MKIRRLILSGLGFIWTLPNTLIGFFIGLFLTFGLPKWGRGFFVFSSGKGISKLVKSFGAHAVTFGYVVIFWDPVFARNKMYLTHEAHHVKQYKLLGPFFLPVYAFCLILS